MRQLHRSPLQPDFVGAKLTFVRLLAVIGSELIGGDERSDWAALNALVALNGPGSVEVRVVAVVNGPKKSITVGSPLGRSVARMPRWDSVPAESYSPSESARGRLDRALQHLRGLGLRASGDIEPGHVYRFVRGEATTGGYDRVLVLLRGDSSWLKRLFRMGLADRLRRTLDVPVDSPGHNQLSASLL